MKFSHDGKLASTGRDRVTKVWDGNGGLQKQFEPFADLGLQAAFSFDDAVIIAGDWTGEVRFWDAEDGKRLAALTANPAPLASRLDEAGGELGEPRITRRPRTPSVDDVPEFIPRSPR